MNIWSIFFTIVLGIWIYYGSYLYACVYHQLCGDTANSTEISTQKPDSEDNKSSTDLKPNPFEITYQGKSWFLGEDFIRFAFSSDAPVLTSKLAFLPDSLKSFLTKNPSKAFEVTGYFMADEQNTSKESNLGLGRAKALGELLKDARIKVSQLIFKGEEKDQLPKIEGDSVTNALSMVLQDLKTEAPAEDEKLKSLNLSSEELAILRKKHLVYFSLASTEPIPNAETSQFIALAKKYLSINPKANIVLTGHTDDTGTAERNIVFGQNRAETLKIRLIQEGFPANQITTQSKGQSEPLVPNDNEENKQKNRRVVIELGGV